MFEQKSFFENHLLTNCDVTLPGSLVSCPAAASQCPLPVARTPLVMEFDTRWGYHEYQTDCNETRRHMISDTGRCSSVQHGWAGCL